MEVIGKIKVISAEQQISPTFRKKELVVVTDEQYPQSIMIEFIQDKSDLLNNYSAGDNVKVSINLTGREYVNKEGETKYFNSIRGWRLEKIVNNATQNQAPPQMPTPAATFAPASSVNDDEPDDLPF